MKLIALCGLHGAGKDTVADALPARKLAFADALYREVAEAWGVEQHVLRCRETKEVPTDLLAIQNCKDVGFFESWLYHPIQYPFWRSASRSPRQILQWWGDYRRAQDPDYFVNAAKQAMHDDADLYGTNDWVITDVRFPNEAAMVRQLGGQIWQIVRPGHNPPCNGHASENDGSAFKPDLVIINNGTLDELRATALQEWDK